MLRIVQIIDTLEAGGAERMAVNYANSLAATVSFSGLVATRSEGLLKSKLNEGVHYLYLNKKHPIDVVAVAKLYRYCKKNNANILHAHSSSYFMAFLIKCLLPKIKIIWHDHYGLSEKLSERKSTILSAISNFFQGIIAVNQNLKTWAQNELYCKNVIYLENFVTRNEDTSPIVLKGISGKRILCLANLRPQKNHGMLLKVAKRLMQTHPEWTFHFVGKDFGDSYSQQLKSTIATEQLHDNVYLYGSHNAIGAIINQCEISVLASYSEGLPLSLLEAGYAKKPVVVTNVGEIPNIIQNGQNGMAVDSGDEIAFYEALVSLIAGESIRLRMGKELYDTVDRKYSERVVIDAYISWIGNSIL